MTNQTINPEINKIIIIRFVRFIHSGYGFTCVFSGKGRGGGGPHQVSLGRGLNKYGRQKEKQRRGRERPVTGRCVALLRGALLEL